MSSAAGPSITTSGLVLDFDMSNTQKSWIGRPSTNTCNYNTYNYTDGNATVTRGATPPIAPPVSGYEISKIQSNNGGDTSMNILYTSNVDQVNGGVYTHSAWVLLTAGTYCRIGQHWNPWDAGPAQYIPLNIWTRVSYTITNYGSNYGNIANAYGTDGTIYVTAVQYEQGSPMTPFMGGSGASRSNTQAIVDLTGNNTLTANSLTYASDGTFSFNGSNDKITLNTNTLISGTSPYTIDVAFKTSAASVDYIFGNYGVISGASGGLEYYVYQSKLNNYISENTQAATTLNLNQWYIASVTRSGSTITHYLNGVADGSGSNAASISATNPFTIGNGHDYTSEAFGGTIGAIKVYNRALSAAEVKQNFNATRSRYGI